MIRKYLQDYFTFTKGERNAVIGLSISLLILFAIPYFLPEEKLEMDERAFALPAAESKTAKKPPDASGTTERFQFDPNTLDVAGWIRLGVPEKTALTIQHYLEKGGKFRSGEDLLKIYGLRQELAMELMEFVRLVPGKADQYSGYPDRHQKTHASGQRFEKFYSPDARASRNFLDSRGSQTNSPFPYRKKNAPTDGNFSGYSSTSQSDGRFPAWKSLRKNVVVDIAVADTTELIALPGIGSKLANRIISFREKLGGFYAPEQLKDLFGLSDSAYQILRPLLKVSPGRFSKININSASEEALRAHPYFRWQLAKAIISYRKEHGAFTTIDDLRRIELLDTESFEKLRPYLEI